MKIEDNMEFIVNIACGLANRMFQYSYYLYLKKHGYNVKVDAYNSGTLAHEKVDWQRIFPNAPIYQANKIKCFMMGGGNDLVSRFRRKYMSSTTKVLYMPTAFTAILPNVSEGSKYIIGVFQNAKAVNEVRNEVLKRFSFAPLSDNYNKTVFEKINGCNSIGIHIRKGNDYQSRIWYQNTCPLDYYKQAVAEISSRIDNPQFFIFADNKQWVKDNFKWLDYTLVDGNPGAGYGCHFDMQLMSYCKHNIISNSTYSWWGAFLNNNNDKIVIMPKIWFNPESCDDYTSNNLLVEGWIQI